GRRLVQHQDVGLLPHERPGERDLLPLPARELDPLLEPAPELRVEPRAQPGDHRVGAAAPGGPDDAWLVLAVIDAAEAHVLPRGELVLVEVLEDDADAAAERLRLPRPEVAAVEEDA